MGYEHEPILHFSNQKSSPVENSHFLICSESLFLTTQVRALVGRGVGGVVGEEGRSRSAPSLLPQLWLLHQERRDIGASFDPGTPTPSFFKGGIQRKLNWLPDQEDSPGLTLAQQLLELAGDAVLSTCAEVISLQS